MTRVRVVRLEDCSLNLAKAFEKLPGEEEQLGLAVFDAATAERITIIRGCGEVLVAGLKRYEDNYGEKHYLLALVYSDYGGRARAKQIDSAEAWQYWPVEWCVLAPREDGAFYYRRGETAVECAYDDCRDSDPNDCYCALGAVPKDEYEEAVEKGLIRNAEILECHRSFAEAWKRVNQLWRGEKQ